MITTYSDVSDVNRLSIKNQPKEGILYGTRLYNVEPMLDRGWTPDGEVPDCGRGLSA